MRFEWIDGHGTEIEKDEKHGISYYKCYLYDDDGKELDEIYFHDYSTPYEVEEAKKNYWKRPYAYEVGYCHGYSMSHGFDYDDDYYDYFGYRGKKTHTVADIKKWCENYLASKYIIDYEAELEKLQERKRKSDWFEAQGYVKMSKDELFS